MLAADLKRTLRGEVLFDAASREAYSRAECIYRVLPLGAVAPAGEDDVREVLRVAREHGIPVTARGGGSAVAGQSLGAGIILDFSRRWSRILEVNTEERWVRVQPGVILSALNRELAAQGLRFGPDPASADFCTLGGMIANNAGGARSIRFGSTRDNVISLRVMLPDGRVIETRPVARGTPPGGHPGALEELARGVDAIVSPNRERIAAVTPDVPRISSGYALLAACGDAGVDLARLLVGSEGTLAITLEAKLRLVPLPRAVATALIAFPDLDAMGEGVVAARGHRPGALELLDRSFLDLLREAGQEEARSLPRTTEAVLILEMEADGEEEAAAAVDRIESDLRGLGLAAAVLRGLDPAARRRIWEIRKAASPILARRSGERRSTRFIEDACVPPARLPRFLAGLRDLLETHRLEAAVFGHAGDGLLHVNPLLDPADPDVGRKMEEIAAEYADRVVALGGALSGEHGDGRLRAPYLGRAFGSVVDLFREVKSLFDPAGILNPGVKVGDAAQRLSDGIDLSPRPERAIPVW
jgi:FAD/FMN-containing dehydrogenase